jgi:hypothetical protein
MEQVVLRKESGEEETVPLLIGGILCEVLGFLSLLGGIAFVAQSTATGAEAVAQQALIDRHVGAVFLLVDGEILQGGAAGVLGCCAGCESGTGELVAEFFGDGRHKKKLKWES